MPAEQEACMCSHITFRLGCMRAVVTLQASLEFTRDCIEATQQLAVNLFLSTVAL